MKPRYALALVVALLAVACSAVQPAKIQVGERCYSCKQPIQDVKIAAALIDSSSQYPFRSPRCLAKYLHEHPADTKGLAFVTDYKTGYMLEAEKAWFVPVALPSADGRGTEPNFYAFRNVHDAEKANTTGSSLQRWASIVASAN